MTRRHVLVAGLAAVCATVLAVTPALATTGHPDGDGTPGSVVSAQDVRVALPVASATTIRYRSTNTDGRPNEVSGIVFTPLLPPPGPLRLIAYAPGTQGLADRCAPSQQFPAGTEYEAGTVGALLARGYAVAVTDYEGLGTPGEHTYVNRKAEAHALLDVARAARHLRGDIPDDGPVALAGYSQGGGASAAAAELAADYAPDLNVVGAYAGAVPADLAAVGRFIDGSAQAGLLFYAVSGIDAAYPELNIPGVLNDRGRTVLHDVRGQCTADSVLPYAGARSQNFTADGRPLTAYLDEEPFRSRVEEQRIGNGRPSMPVLIVHSVADDIVPFEQDRDMARRWCAAGSTVDFVPVPVPTHVGAAPAASALALPYLDARFAGAAAPRNCP